MRKIIVLSNCIVKMYNYDVKKKYNYFRDLTVDLFWCYPEKGDVTPHRMDANFLLRFLRARHFKLHAAYKLVS